MTKLSTVSESVLVRLARCRIKVLPQLHYGLLRKDSSFAITLSRAQPNQLEGCLGRYLSYGPATPKYAGRRAIPSGVEICVYQPRATDRGSSVQCSRRARLSPPDPPGHGARVAHRLLRRRPTDRENPRAAGVTKRRHRASESQRPPSQPSKNSDNLFM
jgi:hypothetical protein